MLGCAQRDVADWVATASFAVQFRVNPSESRLASSAFASTVRVALFIFTNTPSMRSSTPATLGDTPFVSFSAELTARDPSAAPIPKRAWSTEIPASATSCTLDKSTAPGLKPVAVSGWRAGAPPVVFVKEPTLARRPESASEKIRLADVVDVVKFIVKPSLSIDTNVRALGDNGPDLVG